jgi:cytochrome c-type biogenesis protein CcmH/NrfF
MRLPSLFARVALAAALLIGAPAASAAAQAQHERPPADKGPHTPHPQALEAIDRLKSPFCPGFMLEVCPSPYAAALRDTLDIMARDGIESDSLVEWALGRYGDTLSALPPARGRSLIAWIVPPAAVILGIAAVVVVLRRLRRPHEGPPPQQVSEEERRRLDEALRELEAEEETQF